jgi:hypothetical protein
MNSRETSKITACPSEFVPEKDKPIYKKKKNLD